MNWFQRYDGGPVGITGNRQAATDWYVKHLGMKVYFDSVLEQQTVVGFPVRNAIPLVSVAGPLWWGGPANLVRESAVRYCLACPDLDRTRAELKAEGVRLGEINDGPGGKRFFDFYDLEGTRLTATAEPTDAPDQPGVRFTGLANLRHGVRDWRQARDWYARYMGMTPVEERPEEGAVLMALGDFLPIWLEQLPGDGFAAGPVSPTCRPEFLALDIEGAHHYATEAGLNPSPLEGEPGAHRAFHLFDPDGNRINIHIYPGAK